MLISSWNVNSVRARIENIKSYLLKYKPDILMMQEIKTEDVNFPYDDFSSMDYESHVFGQKSYNGVAIISKNKLKNVKTDLIKDKLKQSRIISAEFEHKKKNIQLINIYTPNGNPVDTEKYDYKKDWLNQLIKQLKTLSKKNPNLILAGDFNIIPSAEDVYNVKSFEDDALYRLEIRKIFRASRIIGKRFKLVHVFNRSELIEVATFRSGNNGFNDGNLVTDQSGKIIRDNVWGTLEEDTYRRDFTINALYYCPITGRIEDHNKGLKHIHNLSLIHI